MPRKPSDNKKQYDRHREQSRLRSARNVAAGQEIAPLPPIVDIVRRSKADCDFKYFCETYFSHVFYHKWSPDHLKVIRKIERVVLHSETLSVAMPRGDGKTTLCQAAVIWSILTGKHQFIELIAGTDELAVAMLVNIKKHLAYNKLLLDDYPEAIYPIVKLGGETRRCSGQRYYGFPTNIEWRANEISMPIIPGSRCSGVIVQVSGITGCIRGALHTRADGTQIRPTLVICDDPQTDESARSIVQVAERIRIINGTILGLSGPGERTGVIVPCTVIQRGDLADQLLDRNKNPSWHGERTKLLYGFPVNKKLWSEYAKIRDESLKTDGDGHEATDFYRKHQAEMDEGAIPAWPERYLAKHGEISAVQHAMNLKYDRGDECFFAEYQNEPVSPSDLSGEILTVDGVCRKSNGRNPGEVPIACSKLTMFVDVHKNLLFYCVCGWEESFRSGYVIEYGVYPQQNQTIFTLETARKTLLDVYPGSGPNGAVQAGLEHLISVYLAKNFPRGSGLMKIDKLLVDMGWEPAQGIIANVKHKCGGSTMIMSKGMAIQASRNPMSTWKKRPGEVHGNHWYVPNVSKVREFPHILFDANYWKTFIHTGLSTPQGEDGCLTIFGNVESNELFARHIAESEQWIDVSALGRTVRQWNTKSNNPDNHWFDCFVGCAVAASYCGIKLGGEKQTNEKQRRVVHVPQNKLVGVGGRKM